MTDKTKKILALFTSVNGGEIHGAQVKVARLLGVTEPVISRYVKGTHKPSKRYISEMARVFAKSEDEIEQIFDVPKAGTVLGAEKEAPAPDGIFHAGEVVVLKPPSDKIPQKLLIQIAPDGRSAFRGADMDLTDTSKEAGKEAVLPARLPDGKYIFGKLVGKTFLQAGGKKTPAGKVQILAPAAQLRINL